MTDLLYDTKHHCLVALPCVQLQKLLEVSKELSALFHLNIELSKISQILYQLLGQTHIIDCIIPSYKSVEHLPRLLRGQFWLDEV